MFKTQNQLVAEIHNEFDTAQERLLNEAKQIIAEAAKGLNEKAERLEKVGFVNSDIVVKHRQKREVLVKNTDEANLIEYYKQTYPFQKFLTESELDKICKKYSLVYAPIANYKKDVPEKNLREIENCGKLAKDDSPKDLWVTSFTIWRVLLPDIKRKVKGLYNFASDIRERFPKLQNAVIEDVRSKRISKQELFIAAPKSHFNLKGLAKEGLLHSTFTITEVKDPIVFRYCKGGVQVISKWGLEADDKDLVNEKLN